MKKLLLLLFLISLFINCITVKAAPYIGEWQVTEVVFHSDIYALSPNDEAALIGGVLSFSEKNISWENTIFDHPIYKVSQVNILDYNSMEMEKFFSQDVEELNVVTIYRMKNGKEQLWEGPFKSFIVLDENTLILSSGGVFFKGERIK